MQRVGGLGIRGGSRFAEAQVSIDFRLELEDFVDVTFGKDGIVTRLDREDAPAHGRERLVEQAQSPVSAL